MTNPASGRSGNILIYLLGAIFLLGILVALVKGSFQEGTSIDNDKLVLRVDEVRRYSAELERGVTYILNNGASESEIRFAEPDDASTPYGDIAVTPQFQMFSANGGGADYKLPPQGVNDGSKWAYFADSHLPGMGTDDPAAMKSDLIAVLPNVSEQFCSAMNMSLGQAVDLAEITDPEDDECVYSPSNEFDGTFLTGTGNNVLETSEIPNTPAPELCVKCEDGSFHYYRVLLSR